MKRFFLVIALCIFVHHLSFAQAGNIVIPSGHDGKILQIVIDKQSKYFYTADEWKIIMWDFNTNTQLFTFPIANKAITQRYGNDIHNLRHLIISPDGNILAFTTAKDELKIYSTKTGKFITSVNGVSSQIAFSKDSKIIYDLIRADDSSAGSTAQGRMVRAINVSTGSLKDYWHVEDMNIWGTFIRYFYPLRNSHIINFNETGYQVLDLDEKKEIIKVDVNAKLQGKYVNIEEFNRHSPIWINAATGLFTFWQNKTKELPGYVVWDIYNNRECAFIPADRNIQMQPSFNADNFFYYTKSNRFDKQDAIIVSKENKIIKKVNITGADEIRLAVLSNKKNTIIYCGEDNQLYKYDLDKPTKEIIRGIIPNIQFTTLDRQGNTINFADEKDYYSKKEGISISNMSANYMVDFDRLITLSADTLPVKPNIQLSSLRLNTDNFMLSYGDGDNVISVYNKKTNKSTPFVLKGFSGLFGSSFNAFPQLPQYFLSKKQNIAYCIITGDLVKDFGGYSLIKYDLTTKNKQKIFSSGNLTGKEWENRDKYGQYNRAGVRDALILDRDNEILATSEFNYKGTLRVLDLNSGKVLAKHPFAYDSAAYGTAWDKISSGIVSEGINNFPFFLHQVKKTAENTVRVLAVEKIFELYLDGTPAKEIRIASPEFIRDKRNIKMYGNNKLESVIAAYNTENGTVAETIYGPYKYKLSNITAPVERIEFSSNDSVLYTINADKTINAYNALTGKFYGTLYTFENSTDWVFVGEDGRFDGTENGMKRLYYLKNREVISIDKVFEKYYTPNLFTRLKNGEKFDPIPDIDFKPKPKTKIYYADVKKANEEERILTYTNTSGTAEITVSATAPDDKVDEIRLFHNGKAVNLATRGLFVTDADGTDTKKYTINLLPGQNNFRAIALNSQRTESEPDEIIVAYNKGGGNAPAPVKPADDNKAVVDEIDRNATLHIVVVGINAYKGKINPLTYALPDATAFKAELEKDAKSVIGNVKSYLIADDAASKAGIVAAFENIKKTAKPEDVFVFYYAGHGYIHPSNKEFYLVSSDVADGGESLLKNGVSAKELQTFAVDIPAQKQLFIMDACQSAGAFEQMLKHDGEQQKALAVVSRSTGTHWMAASGSTETAKEFGELGHGVFTYSLLEALKGKAVNNKMITVNGLKNYLQIIVPELVKKYGGNSQYPASYGFGNDFPVEIMK